MKSITGLLLLLAALSAEARHSTTNPSTSSLTSVPRRNTKQQRRPAFVNDNGAPSSCVTDVRGGEQGTGTATMSNEMFNMVKAVVGVGVLSLPAGEYTRMDDDD